MYIIGEQCISADANDNIRMPFISISSAIFGNGDCMAKREVLYSNSTIVLEVFGARTIS